jgi:hypothetical protein
VATINYTWPEAIALRVIEMDLLPRLEEDRPWTKFFPIEESEAFYVRWEQRDNFQGLAQIRGLDGDPPKVNRIGIQAWQMQPGVYGEQGIISEAELTLRRDMGDFYQVIPIDDLVAEIQLQLLQRELDRIELIIWTLCSYGVFSVTSFNGSLVQQDAYAIQLYSAAVVWSTAATSTPLADFRGIQLLSRGHSVSFGSNAEAYMNRTQLNYLLSNTNTNDFAGRRVSGLLSVLNLGEINAILEGEDLPMIVPYDAGYYSQVFSANVPGAYTFNLFIPTGKTIVIGKRPNNAPVGSYIKTRNVNDPNGKGSYTRVVDTGASEALPPPRKISVHRGHNGGPAIFFPSAVVAVSC